MCPTNISFDGATDFEISGGNFGTVQGNLTTTNLASRNPQSHSSTRRAGPRSQRSNPEADYPSHATRPSSHRSRSSSHRSRSSSHRSRSPSVTSASSLVSIEEFEDGAGGESDYSSPPSSLDPEEAHSFASSPFPPAPPPSQESRFPSPARTISSLGEPFVHLPRPFAETSRSPLGPVHVVAAPRPPTVPSALEVRIFDVKRSRAESDSPLRSEQHQRNYRSSSPASSRSTSTNRHRHPFNRGGEATSSPFVRPSNPEPGQAPRFPPLSTTPTSRSNYAFSTSSNGTVSTPRSHSNAATSSPRSSHSTPRHSSHSLRGYSPTHSGTVNTPLSARPGMINRDIAPPTVQPSYPEVHSPPAPAIPTSNRTPRLPPREQTPQSVRNSRAVIPPNAHPVSYPSVPPAPESGNRVFSAGGSNHASYGSHDPSITTSWAPSPSPSGPPFDCYHRGPMDVRSPYIAMSTAPFAPAVWPPNSAGHHSHQWTGQQVPHPYAPVMPFLGPVPNGYGTPFQNYPMGWGGTPYGGYPPR